MGSEDSAKSLDSRPKKITGRGGKRLGAGRPKVRRDRVPAKFLKQKADSPKPKDLDLSEIGLIDDKIAARVKDKFPKIFEKFLSVCTGEARDVIVVKDGKTIEIPVARSHQIECWRMLFGWVVPALERRKLDKLDVTVSASEQVLNALRELQQMGGDDGHE